MGLRPTLVDMGEEETEARLLIGDKVVCEEPTGFPFQLDLGQAWQEFTGLPFVFATWVARQEPLLSSMMIHRICATFVQQTRCERQLHGCPDSFSRDRG